MVDPNANIAPLRDPIGEAIGSSAPRLEAEEKITGTAVYTDDMTLPGMLHAAVVGSDYPHARILAYDIDAARALAGVKAVITGEDLEMAPVGQMIKDETALARGKVRYIGEPVVAIAAVTLDIARAAARDGTGFEALPENARLYVEKIEGFLGFPIISVGVGPDREATIERS